MEMLTPGLGLMAWTLLAFIVVLIILKKYAWLPITKALQEREDGISQSLLAAQKMKQEMAQMKQDFEQLSLKANEEKAAILRDTKLMADNIIAEAKLKGAAEYDTMLKNAQSVIQQQKNAALIDVKNYVGQMVVSVSEKLIRNHLSNNEEQQKLIKQLVDSVTLN